MTRQDPELFTHVDNLKAEDAAIRDEQKKLAQFIDRLAHLAPLVEPDERKFNDLQAHLRKDGIAFVARVRTQQVPLETWYLEAFHRDRGYVD
jgi:hypothetical protein